MRIAVIGTRASRASWPRTGSIPSTTSPSTRRATHAGGHTNTVRVDLADETQWVDTGFIVYNDRNYPNFEPLLAELGVATQPSHMSFSVSDGGALRVRRHAARAVRQAAPTPSNPRFLRMIRDLVRFNREARALLELAPGEGPSLREFLDDGGYSRLVRGAPDRAPGGRGLVGRARSRCGPSPPASSRASSTTTGCSASATARSGAR